MPTVSVIIPTYNRASVLSRAVESVLHQTFDDYEIIIVDDGSTDNTEDIVYSFSDNRIHYHRLSENQGANTARNAGIELAEGSYFAFLDADDGWHQTKLKRQVEKFERAPNSTGLVYTGIVNKNSAGDIIGRSVPKYSGNVLPHLMRGNFIGTFSSVMVRSQVMNSISLNENLPSWQDWCFYLDVAKEWSIVPIAEPLVLKYFDKKDRISKNYKEKKNTSYPIMRQKMKDIVSETDELTARQSLASLDFRLGYNALKNGYYLDARLSLARSLVKYPARAHVWVYFLVSLGGRFTYVPSRYLKRRLPL